MVKLFSYNVRLSCFRFSKVYPDPAFLKYFNWDVKKDPKGCQKAKSLSVAKMTSTKIPKMNSCRLKKMVKKKREVSVLKS